MENAKKPDLTPKQKAAKAKSDYDLHTLLIMRKDGVNKSAALLSAYLEGPNGLTVRLGG